MLSKLPHDHAGLRKRECKSCGEVKEPEEFSIHKHSKCYGGYQASSNCKDCERTRKLKSHLKNSYNLELEDYNKMVESQNNKCLLCGEEPSDTYGRLVVDHCHIAGEVRGLLCRMCNIHLSRLEKSPEYLKKVLKYLGH